MPTPTGGPDGKTAADARLPKPPGKPGQRRRDRQTIPRREHRHSNRAIGPNVLDIDDLALLHPMRKRFGDTPLIGKTAGRGGYQLYYRASPHVRAADLRATDGIPVEIKAGGNIVITPPSRSPITGREYELIEGRFDHETLASLPQINVPAICDTKTAADHRSICEGLRDNWLFSVCLRHAHHVDDFDALLDVGRTRNDECEPPLLTTR